MSEKPLTEEELRAWILGYEETMRGLCRDLREARTGLANEAETRGLLRAQERRIADALMAAGVPVGDLVAGVAALVAERDAAARAASDVAHEQVARERRCADAAEGERDEMRGARDVLLAEVDRLRARLADVEACLEGQDAGERIGIVR